MTTITMFIKTNKNVHQIKLPLEFDWTLKGWPSTQLQFQTIVFGNKQYDMLL